MSVMLLLCVDEEANDAQQGELRRRKVAVGNMEACSSFCEI